MVKSVVVYSIYASGARFTKIRTVSRSYELRRTRRKTYGKSYKHFSQRKISGSQESVRELTNDNCEKILLAITL